METPSVQRVIRNLGEYDALLLVSALWFLAKFLRYAFPPLFEPLQGVYGVSNAEVGFAFTGFMLVYAAMQFPSGAIADRIGSVSVIAAGALVAAGAALTLIVDSPFIVLVAAMVLMGAGTGAHKTVAIRLLSRIYPARTGRALGVMDTIGTFGGVAAPAAVVVALGLPGVFGAGWRTLFLVGGLSGVALAVGFLVRVPARVPGEQPVEPATDGDGDVARYVTLFRRPGLLAFVLVTILFGFAYNGLVAFLPLYLTTEAGLTAGAAGLLYSVLFLASLVQVLTGALSDRIGTLPVIVATLSLASASVAALVFLTPSGDPIVLGIVVALVGLGCHGFRPVRGAYLLSVLPTSIAGGGLGVVRTLLMGSGAVAPAVVGILSEMVGFVQSFWILAGSIVIATTVATALLVNSLTGGSELCGL